jgi:hypothetical protein
MARTLIDQAPAPAEALIPEAKHHQRRRYRRAAILVSLVVVLVGGLIALLIAQSSESGTSRATAQPPVAVGRGGPVLVRPVLCYAPPYSAKVPRETGPLPACPAPYALTASALNVAPRGSPQAGFSMNNVGPYSVLAGYPSTTHDSPGHVVLLNGTDGRGSPAGMGGRYLLGPSSMRLSASNVRSVVAEQNHYGAWVVMVRLSPAESARWDAVAEQSFHSYLALDVGGKVVTTPLIQPAQAGFTSFKGVMEWSGGFNASTARAVAAAVRG